MSFFRVFRGNVFPVASLSRRELLIRAGAGFGGVALTGLLHPEIVRASAKAKSIIFLFMYGGPSQVDLFDPKPDLTRHHGKPMTGKGAIDVFFGNPGNLMASPYSFKKYGQSGIDVSELFPNVAECVDDLCVIRSSAYDKQQSFARHFHDEQREHAAGQSVSRFVDGLWSRY